MWQSIFLVNTIFLCLLSTIFVLDCLLLYFSGPFSFESLKSLFHPTESFQFGGMRLCQLFSFSKCYVYHEINIFIFWPLKSPEHFLSHFYFLLAFVILCWSFWWPVLCLSFFSSSCLPTPACWMVLFFQFFTWRYQKKLTRYSRKIISPLLCSTLCTWLLVNR